MCLVILQGPGNGKHLLSSSRFVNGEEMARLQPKAQMEVDMPVSYGMVLPTLSTLARNGDIMRKPAKFVWGNWKLATAHRPGKSSRSTATARRNRLINLGLMLRKTARLIPALPQRQCEWAWVEQSVNTRQGRRAKECRCRPQQL